MTVCVEISQHPLIIDSGAHTSIVDRELLEKHFPNWESQIFPTKAKNLKNTSGKNKSIWAILKELVIPHKKSNIRPNQEFVVLEDTHIQRFLPGTVYGGCMGLKFTIVKIGILPWVPTRRRKLHL
ncbi:hypothetical protein O181_027259 [Austropuccinia psidii MF-1]|uniref:Uncharacterized protein n=1 Tax=Austropuccinia psidii MF-1 TaxID=1389203 RepID=A0A9Q3CLM2_9BASI|nr:hypothetical protein [Austropuccinia psidii MF-1]